MYDVGTGTQESVRKYVNVSTVIFDLEKKERSRFEHCLLVLSLTSVPDRFHLID